MNKKTIFAFLMFLMPVIVLIVGVKVINKRYYPVKSDYERDLEKLGGTRMTDLRARAPYVVFRPNPGAGGSGMNSLGFHSPEISKDKKANEFRIAIVGGSTAFIGDYSFVDGKLHDTSIIGVLTEILKKNSPSLREKDVQYINAAIPSAVSGQSLAQFIWHLLPLKIDLLIVFDGYNDFFCPTSGYDPRPGYPYDYFVEEYRYYNFAPDKDSQKGILSLFKEGFYNPPPQKIVTGYLKELGIEKLPISELKPRVCDAYIENMSKISTIASAYGIKSAIFLQPYSPIHNDPKRAECKVILDIYAMASERYKVLSEKNSPMQIFCDLTYMGDRMRTNFIDIGHINEEGNKMIAEEMYTVMKKERMMD